MTADAGTTVTVTVTATNSVSTVGATSTGVLIDSFLLDPYFSSVKLLMGFNGLSGSTGAPGMSDESGAVRGNATVVGNAQITSAQSKFGGTSLALDGTGDYITFPDSPDWDFGTGQFTIEGYFRFTAAPNALLISQWGSNFAFYFEGGNLKLRSNPSNDTTLYPWVPTLNQWYKIAIDRDASSVARIYVDGVMVSRTNGYTNNLSGSGAVLAIGSLTPAGFGGYDVNGYVDEVRVSSICPLRH